MTIYHGGTDIVETPRILTAYTGRGFGAGFYTTEIREQAEKWARRQARSRKQPEAVLNIYEFDNALLQKIKVRTFGDYTMDWLDFVVECRQNAAFRHEYDLVIGKIANDAVGETIQAVVDGLTSKEFALSRLVFMPTNNQICFSTNEALKYLKFIKAERLD
jgi:hypothetical protein